MSTPLVTAVGLAAIAVLVAASAFFSSSETAIFTLPAVAAADPVGTGDPRAAALATLRSDPHRLLVTILVGNNVVNVAISSITTVLVLGYLSPGVAVTVATVVASFVVLVFGEIVPKSYGLAHARGLALAVAGPLVVTGRLLYPLVAVFEAITGRLNAWIGGDPDIEQPYLAD